ncbi:MAG: hypothetical protein R3C14_05660 [Caldilineaceae bacterium]
MLVSSHIESEPALESTTVLRRPQITGKRYFCPNSSCLSDELTARAASSFANVWIVTDEELDRSWLMAAPQPSCPHCNTPLYATSVRSVDVVSVCLPLM